MPALLLPYQGKSPKVPEDAFIAPTATLIGDVEIGAGSSIWYGCTIRGDANFVRVGKNSNIQDGSVIHVDPGNYAAVVGDNVLVGHLSLIHGCTLEDDSFVGMKACVMNGAVIESGGMVAAGALVTPGKIVKSGQLWAGSPAKPLRDLSKEEIAGFREAADRYAGYARQHIAEGNAAV